MIETSTECCSAALCKGYNILAKRMTDTPKKHASVTAPYIEEILDEAGLTIGDCDAVAVSEGPGSYTGLRVGVSTAKGLCFGASKPLIGINTLQILAMQGLGKADLIVPMIDARRMEVYCSTFDINGTPLSETKALILDSKSFKDELSSGTVLFIGNGVAKFKSVIDSPNALFEECCPLAESMARPAIDSLQKKEFKDVAYFEPFYLKEFVAGISKKSVL